VGQQTPIVPRRLAAALLLALAAAGLYALKTLPRFQIHLSGRHTLWTFLAAGAGVLAVQQLLLLGVAMHVRFRKGHEGDIRMLGNFIRIMTGLALLIAFVYALGVLKAIGVVAAGFAGMLLGWSLQAPVSGLAAWAGR